MGRHRMETTREARACASPVSRWSTRILGAVVHIDSFGNLITNIRRERFGAATPEQLAEAWVTTPFHSCTGLSATYGDHPPGSLIALFGSFNTLESARVNGRADRGPQDQALPLGLPVEVKLWT